MIRPFYIYNVSDNPMEITLRKEGEAPDLDLEYSSNLRDWYPWYYKESSIGVFPKSDMYFRGHNKALAGSRGCHRFDVNQTFEVAGDITSLLDPAGMEDLVEPYAFTGLLRDCLHLKSALHLVLPTGLTKRCFSNLFDGDLFLEYPPALRATGMAESCYASMFYGCYEMWCAPELPATKLARGCYKYMFFRCIRIKEVPVLPAQRMSPFCYEFMWAGCDSLKEVPNLSATKLAAGCYLGMFRQCENLTKEPNLPATDLRERCYESMFQDCIHLVVNKGVPNVRFASRYCKDMFKNCLLDLNEPKEKQKYVNNIKK